MGKLMTRAFPTKYTRCSTCLQWVLGCLACQLRIQRPCKDFLAIRVLHKLWSLAVSFSESFTSRFSEHTSLHILERTSALAESFRSLYIPRRISFKHPPNPRTTATQHGIRKQNAERRRYSICIVNDVELQGTNCL
jgi:hypothetical protein